MEKWVVFSCSQPVLLMYTPKQPEAHSNESQWLTWQSAWQPLCTLETPLRLYSRPVLPCSTTIPSLSLHGIPHFPLPSPPSHMPRHIWHPSTKPSISASQSHCDANSFGNSSTPWNWHTIHNRKHCPLKLNFLNKNEARRILVQREISIGVIQKMRSERGRNNVLLVADTHSAALY